MSKGLIYIGIIVGGFIGSYLSTIFFNSNGFDVASIICGTIGSVFGIWLAVKYSNNDY
jgi:uncharacterized membrane protein YeaQ/YmgE (transglycosylase-associated protein family)